MRTIFAVRHIPRTVDHGIAERFHHVPGVVPNEQATHLRGSGSPVRRGKLPTITHPVRNTVNAVVKPTPPGRGPGSVVASIWAKVVMEPSGAASMMVVPVRCNTRPYEKSYNCFIKTSRPLSS